MEVVPRNNSVVGNISVPPDTLWLELYQTGNQTPVIKNKTFAYTFKGEVLDVKSKEIEQKVLTYFISSRINDKTKSIGLQ
jgi:hypothetical protein